MDLRSVWVIFDIFLCCFYGSQNFWLKMAFLFSYFMKMDSDSGKFQPLNDFFLTSYDLIGQMIRCIIEIERLFRNNLL